MSDMRPSSRTLFALLYLLAGTCVALSVFDASPELRLVRTPLWLVGAAFGGILLDRRLDGRL